VYLLYKVRSSTLERDLTPESQQILTFENFRPLVKHPQLPSPPWNGDIQNKVPLVHAWSSSTWQCVVTGVFIGVLASDIQNKVPLVHAWSSSTWQCVVTGVFIGVLASDIQNKVPFVHAWSSSTWECVRSVWL
jgi:hypothetical protein